MSFFLFVVRVPRVPKCEPFLAFETQSKPCDVCYYMKKLVSMSPAVSKGSNPDQYGRNFRLGYLTVFINYCLA